MAISAVTKPITLKDLEAVDGLDEYKGMEIVDGVWTPKHEEGSVSIGHGKYGATILALLWIYLQQNPVGEVYLAETIFVLHVDDAGVQTMRKPDTSFVANERVKPPQEGYYFQAPDIAVEVISPSDRRPGVLHRKLTDYFTYGTQQVWLVYQDEKRIVIQNADGTATTYELGDTISGIALLPGFSLKVAEIFRTIS
ncbi:MAG TPA: Uma2 family endonuclease [Phototrophicaceae bacterium]|nr:Uma2 family endonuclease [Phototrophicaceae bacterium]